MYFRTKSLFSYRQIPTLKDYYRFTFFPGSIIHWNALPAHIPNLPTLAQFSSQGSYRNRKSKFKDFSRTIYIFSRSHFSSTVTHLTLLIRRISVPFKIVYACPFRAHCFCPISALRIVYARYFRFCLSRFPLCNVSLPVAFEWYYLNRIE